MHVHILGVCGTFMGGIAAIAKAAGFSHVITCDLGGTSFDVSLIADGQMELAAQATIDFGMVIRSPMIEITTSNSISVKPLLLHILQSLRSVMRQPSIAGSGRFGRVKATKVQGEAPKANLEHSVPCHPVPGRPWKIEQTGRSSGLRASNEPSHSKLNSG